MCICIRKAGGVTPAFLPVGLDRRGTDRNVCVTWGMEHRLDYLCHGAGDTGIFAGGLRALPDLLYPAEGPAGFDFGEELF